MFHWFTLALLAGSINAGGYMACHQFVTHVTGFATLAGIDWAHARWDAAIGILTVPVYFLIGVMLSAYMVDRRAASGKRPMYAAVMLAVCLCLVLVALFGHLEWFGEFGSRLKLKRDYFLLAFLCLASGLQNAAITSASGATIRTTHLTGITTDLGIGLVRCLGTRGAPLANDAYRHEMRVNALRLGTILSFMVGSALGAWFFIRLEYSGFLISAAIALYAAGVAALNDSAPSSR